MPHWRKLTIGGFLTGICGWIFITMSPGSLIPLGPNYEAVREVLAVPHPSSELMSFAFLKLSATLFSLGSGGVSAMFVPLFLSGGAIGNAFAQSIVHSPTVDLYAAVGMAAFIAGGYKAPLTAVVFVAETTGGHAYIIPSLIGAACSYAISGELSASGDQRLHEAVRFSGVAGVAVREVMQRQVIAVQANASLRSFAESVAAHDQHAVFPVSDDGRSIGTAAVWKLIEVAPDKWDSVQVADIADSDIALVDGSCDVMEALRLIVKGHQQMLLVTATDGSLEGIVTKTDILRFFEGPARRNEHQEAS